VGDVLQRLKVPASVVADGGVFIDKERVQRLDRPLRPGECVRVHMQAPVESHAASPLVLQQRGGVLAVAKPSGLPTIPDEKTGDSLLQWVAKELGLAASRVHPSSRLDREVSGVVTFALDEPSRELLHAARAQGQYKRRYVALVAGAPQLTSGRWDAPIGRTKNPRHRAAHGDDAKPAESYFRCVAATPVAQLLALEPVTGRTHQLRVHCASSGAAILGDRVYGQGGRLTAPSGAVLQVPRVMLHAAAVHIRTPGLDFAVRAAIADDLRSLWQRLGGEAGVWDTAGSWELAVASAP
jgi:RluA family pseudouridine synthase